MSTSATLWANGVLALFYTTQTPNVAPACLTVTTLPLLQCNALAALYNRTNGPNWTNKTGWSGLSAPRSTTPAAQAITDPCTWYGVTCANGQVTELDLANNNLSGSLPPELGSLTALDLLDLSGNKLTGVVPDQLGNLTNLTELYLDNNPQLGGVLPASLTQLLLLDTFYFDNTSLVELPDPAFQAWLGGIPDLRRTNVKAKQVLLPLIIK